MMGPTSRLGCGLLVVACTVMGACGQGSEALVGELPPPASGPAGVLTIGSVSLNPAQEYEVCRPLANYLASKLNEVGIGSGRVVVVDSLRKMVDELEAGRVDIYIDSPFPVGFVLQRTDARVLLRRWKRGSNIYSSVIFTRTDSGVDSIEDLRGQVIAFGESFSTSGYLMPKAALASSGLNLVNYEDPAASVPRDQVGYVFSDDAENTMFWVLKEKVTAGAVNEYYYLALAGSRADELKVLYRTESMPRNLVCTRSTLDPMVRGALVTILLGMDGEEEGRSVLQLFEETTRFDRFPDGPESALERVVALLPFVEEDLGE